MANSTMMSTRRSPLLNFTAPLVLEPPRHCGLSPIALIPGRHLIGRGDDSAIRVSLDGVMDRHALILVGENRTVVKSIDARTWVNDSPVSEMALRSGDRLSIGPLTFRVRSATREEAAAFVSAASADSKNAEAIVRESPSERVSSESKPVEIKPPELVNRVETEGVFSPLTEPVTKPDRAEFGAVQPPAPNRPEVRSEPVGDCELIDLRLNDLEQRLAQLSQPAEPECPPVISTPQTSVTDSNEVARQLELRHDELQRRSEDLAAESQRLQVRTEHVAEREARIESRCQELTRESERIAEAARIARDGLAAEHAQRLATWQEWDTTYARLSAAMTSQSAAIEQQRAALQVDHERLGTITADLQRAQGEFEQARKSLSADQSRLAKDRAEFAALKSEFDDQRQRHQRETDEREALIQSERLKIAQQQSELLTTQQDLDRERQQLQAERTAHLHQIERDSQKQTDLQAKYDHVHQQYDAERREVIRLTEELRQTQSERQVEQQIAASSRQRAEDSLHELQDLRSRSQATDLEMAELRRQLSALQAKLAVGPTREFPASNSSAVPLAIPPEPPPLPAEYSEDGEIHGTTEWSLSDLASQDSEVEWPPSAAPDCEPGPYPEINHESFGAFGDSSEGDRSAYLPVPGAMSAWPTSDSELGTGRPASVGADPWANVPVSLERGPSPYHETPSAQFEIGGPVDPWAVPVVSDSRHGAPIQEHSEIESQSYENDPGLQASTTIDPNETSEDYSILEQLMENRPPQVQSVEETLDAINRDFGVPTDESQRESSAPALPSWWDEKSSAADSEVPDESGHPSWVVDALRNSPINAAAATPETPATDLRSQLAMLFDLPASALETKTEVSSGEDADERDCEQAAATSSMRLDVPEPADSAIEKSIAASPEPTSCAPEEKSGGDSVEEFMAQLLARSRTSASDLASGKSSVPAPVAPPPVPKVEPEVLTQIAAADRSHLMAEPKHKQNKQAVRENLQSFRQVAHLSARSALARHSLQQVRNATIAKGVLFGISAAYGTIFLTDPLWGNPFQLWKAGACLLATILSGMETHRSWKQLRNPLGPKPATPPPDEPIEVAAVEQPLLKTSAATEPSSDSEQDAEPQ